MNALIKFMDATKEKILLINPPSGFLLDQKVFLPLGVANVAAVASQRGHQVNLIDLSDIGDYQARVREEVTRGRYDAVGITATSPQFFYATRILDAIKSVRPTLKVILGGSHASMFSSLRRQLLAKFAPIARDNVHLEELVHNEDPNFSPLERFDVIAEGEEESLFLALKGDQKWVNGGVTEDIDDLPLPARHFFDMKSYLTDPQGNPKFRIDGKPSGSLISQRGCPFKCEFCCGRDSVMYHQVILPGGKLRAHSPRRILDELDSMNNEFGLTSFMFYDDEFNLNVERTKDICEALKGRGYKFRGFIKSDLLVKSPEVATAMKDAGFVEVLTGVESGSQRILGRHLHKMTTPDINYEAAMICLRNGLGYKALTLLGHTSETPRDIMDTRDWLLRTGHAFNDALGKGNFTFDLTVFQPYAGCPIWDRAERNNGPFSDQFAWHYNTKYHGEVVDPELGGLYFNKVDFSTEHGFYKGIPGQYKAFIRTQTVSSEQFVTLRDAIEWEVRDRLGMPQLATPK